MALVGDLTTVITLESDSDEDSNPRTRIPSKRSVPIVVLSDEDDEDYQDTNSSSACMERLSRIKAGKAAANLQVAPSENHIRSRIPMAPQQEFMAGQATNPFQNFSASYPQRLPRSIDDLSNAGQTLTGQHYLFDNDFDLEPRFGRVEDHLRPNRPSENHLQQDLDLFDDYLDLSINSPPLRETSPFSDRTAERDEAEEIGLTMERPEQTFDEILAVVVEVLPDICHDHVREKYEQFRDHLRRLDAETLLARILAEERYPKQKKLPKRKRDGSTGDDDDDDDDDQEQALYHVLQDYQIPLASKTLQKQFPLAPAQYINTVLKAKKSVYQTIIFLNKTKTDLGSFQNQGYKPLRKRRRGSIDIEDISDPGLKAQFRAAERKFAKDERTEKRRQMEAEEDVKATKRAFELNDISECQCCFDTYPNAKMAVCDAHTPHPFCLECLASHIKAQLDLQKHDIRCMDSSGCDARFSYTSKKKACDVKTFERLERVQQQNELRDAGLPLSHCPFCDFAAICPPVEEDRELRCLAPNCLVVSCRLCQQQSHLPMSCEEYKKEQGVHQRHQIEEEMTKAFLRMCPKCKIPIVKEGGCNKITCSRCHSHICDVCGKDITKEGYSHFGRQCAQSDDSDSTQRAAKRVEAAEEAARQQVLAENPDLTATDLEIKISDAVKNVNRDTQVRQAAALLAIQGGIRDQHQAAARMERARREHRRRIVRPDVIARAVADARRNRAMGEGPVVQPNDRWVQTAPGIAYQPFPFPQTGLVPPPPLAQGGGFAHFPDPGFYFNQAPLQHQGYPHTFVAPQVANNNQYPTPGQIPLPLQQQPMQLPQSPRPMAPPNWYNFQPAQLNDQMLQHQQMMVQQQLWMQRQQQRRAQGE